MCYSNYPHNLLIEDVCDAPYAEFALKAADAETHVCHHNFIGRRSDISYLNLAN